MKVPSLLKTWGPILATAGVLVAVEYKSHELRTEPEAATAYLAACREAVEQIPYAVEGGWIGQDAPVPTQAEDILQPNVLVSRSYRRLDGTASVGLLLVQTSDVQRLLGHYPPNCYPGRGWTLLGSEPGDWSIGDLNIDGTIYQMAPPGAEDDEPVHIYNYMLRPDGKTGRDMEAVWAAGRTGQSRFFGAGQMQVLFFGDMTAAEREAAFEQFVLSCEPAIAQILDGYEVE